MDVFRHEGFDLAYLDSGAGEPVLLIHGFASSYQVNWVGPGWVKTLNDAGYRAIALDNRGHGASAKSYRPEDYRAEAMAGDAAALLDRLGIPRAHVFGYSMGARIAAFLALGWPGKVASVIFGGLGVNLVKGVGDWDPIARALLNEDPATIPDERGRMFRAFADNTRSDRRALAACIATSRETITPAEAARIGMPALVAVGGRDDIAGSPEELSALLPRGEPFVVIGRDHNLSVGDRTLKARVLEFLRAHPIGRTES